MTEETEAAPMAAIIESGPEGALLEQVRSLVEEHLRPELINVTDPLSDVTIPAILTREGVEAVPAHVFDDYLTAPRDRRGTANMTSLSSFIDHVQRFKSPHSAIFACDDRTRPALTAVLDYNPAGADSAPTHGRHRTTFAFPLSDEWKAWQAANDKKMGMADFAAFLEDRIVDVDADDAAASDEISRLITTLGGRRMVASPTKLIELSRGLAVHENAVIREAVKLSSGEGEVVFQSEHMDAAGDRLTVPTMFLLAIPVFRNGAPYQVLARLRYRKGQNGLVFWYELSRTDRVFDHAFDEAVEQVQTATSLPVFRGAPEA